MFSGRRDIRGCCSSFPHDRRFAPCCLLLFLFSVIKAFPLFKQISLPTSHKLLPVHQAESLIYHQIINYLVLHPKIVSILFPSNFPVRNRHLNGASFLFRKLTDPPKSDNQQAKNVPQNSSQLSHCHTKPKINIFNPFINLPVSITWFTRCPSGSAPNGTINRRRCANKQSSMGANMTQIKATPGFYLCAPEPNKQLFLWAASDCKMSVSVQPR